MRPLSEQLAHTAVEFFNMDLARHGQAAVLEAKRSLLDSLGVALSAYRAPACAIIRKWARETGGKGEATVFGEGIKVPVAHASLANGTLLRYWDYNDSYESVNDNGWHCSEVIPSVLAVGESTHASGESVLKGIILGYELGARLCDAKGKTSRAAGAKGIHHGTYGCLVVPATVGPLMRLSDEQIWNAIGTSGGLVLLGILDAMPVEPNTMAKNVAFPLASWLAITASTWARDGFTGSPRVFEGARGLVAAVFGKTFDVAALGRSLRLPWKRYAILETGRKMYPVCAWMQGAVSGVHELVTHHTIAPELVDRITIRASKGTVKHNGDVKRYYAINKESADHSIPFAVSRLLLDKELGPAQFTPDRLRDPRVAALIPRIALRPDRSKDTRMGAVDVEIRMKDKQRFSTQIRQRKGLPGNPLTDEELIQKFRTLTAGALRKADADACIRLVYDLEHVKDVSELIRHLRIGVG